MISSRNVPTALLSADLRFGASTNVDKQSISTMKGNRYAKVLEKSVNKYKMEFDELPKEVHSVKVFNQYTGRNSGGPLFFLELIVDAFSGPQYKNETTIQADFEGEFSYIDTPPLKFDFPYQKLSHWFPTTPMNQAVEKALDTIRQHVPVVRAQNQQRRNAIQQNLNTMLSETQTQKREAEAELAKLKPQKEAAMAEVTRERATVETAIKEQLDQEKDKGIALKADLDLLETKAVATSVRLESLGSRTDVSREELLAAVQQEVKAKADVKQKAAALQESKSQVTLLEQKLKAQQDKVRTLNSSFYKINDRMRALENQLEQASSDLEQISSMLTKFDGYLNGTQTLTSDEKYEYGRLATEKQLSYHRRNRRTR